MEKRMDWGKCIFSIIMGIIFGLEMSWVTEIVISVVKEIIK